MIAILADCISKMAQNVINSYSYCQPQVAACASSKHYPPKEPVTDQEMVPQFASLHLHVWNQSTNDGG